MKQIGKICTGAAMLCCLLFVRAKAADGFRYIEPGELMVSLNKTTNLIFHYKIKQVDVGSADIIAKLCNDTVLLVKAAKADFVLSNLSIYTADGRLHAFTVGYAAAPEHLYLQVEDEGAVQQVSPVVKPAAVTANVMEANSNKLLAPGHQKSLLRHRHGLVRLKLLRISTQGDLLYFPLEIDNRSALSYEALRLRCFIRDKGHVRRMASQEQEVKPLYITGEGLYVPAGSHHRLVLVLPRLSLPDGKFLRISFTEKEGARPLWLDVRNTLLERAKQI